MVIMNTIWHWTLLVGIFFIAISPHETYTYVYDDCLRLKLVE